MRVKRGKYGPAKHDSHTRKSKGDPAGNRARFTYKEDELYLCFPGIQARIAKIQPLAIYSHCANHRLNLGISKGGSVSAGRIHKLETEMQDKLPHLKKGKHALKKCEIRWVEKHDAVLTFLDTLPCLPVVLGTIYDSSESRGSNAFSFLHAIQSSEFLVSVVVLVEVFGLTLHLVWKLQAKYMDVLEAIKLVEAMLASLREQRYKSTDTFKKIFRVRKVGNKNRSNFNSQTVEEYYRTEVYLLPMDFIINELSFRFPKSELQRVGQIQKLLSPDFSDGLEDEVLQSAEPYTNDFPPLFSFERKITSLEADMEIKPFTKVSKVSC
ncbi:hypothetical protein PR048_014969 [Dryococelus australis]|uniref:Uncharacterized protein n=1 Tax=Dryococelus australis TaxID=614101 RepID=A0ABQ9HFT4_9NEOP|nr:hypothetical protein PR048_014969 [Dryococelus australis]